jgi:AAA+ ATPase superfamily predicted ATPase
MFIGRKQEIAALDRLYHSEKFEFAVVYVSIPQ